MFETTRRRLAGLAATLAGSVRAPYLFAGGVAAAVAGAQAVLLRRAGRERV